MKVIPSCREAPTLPPTSAGEELAGGDFHPLTARCGLEAHAFRQVGAWRSSVQQRSLSDRVSGSTHLTARVDNPRAQTILFQPTLTTHCSLLTLCYSNQRSLTLFVPYQEVR